MANNDLIKKSDIQHIAEIGSKIYERIKINYDPQERGKFLAIDIDTQKTYLGDTSAEALFDVAETMARSFIDQRP